MGQYLSACFSSDATDDDAYDRHDLELLLEHGQRIADLQCRVNEDAQPPRALEKSSYTADQVVTLVDGTQAVIVDGKIKRGQRIHIYRPPDEPSGEDESVDKVMAADAEQPRKRPRRGKTKNNYAAVMAPSMVGNHITRVISGSGNYRKFPVITRADFWLPGNDPWGGRLKI